MKEIKIPTRKLRKTIKTSILRSKVKHTKCKSMDSSCNGDRSPIPGSSISTFLHKNPILAPDFFQIDAIHLAPLLLGKYLRRDDVVLQITEVEAYRPDDSACHGRVGITARTAPMFGPGGHAYVYLCYGLHTMLNIVADKQGVGAAVLIRACAPVSGLETIQQRRGLITEKPALLTGPGKVGQALGISKEWSNHSLFSPGGLELLDGPQPDKILVGPRVGIEYALPEHINALWRFAVAGSPWIFARVRKGLLVQVLQEDAPPGFVFYIREKLKTLAPVDFNKSYISSIRLDDASDVPFQY